MTSALLDTGSTRRWRKLRALVLIRDGFRCQVPMDDGTGRLCMQYATHADHITARVDGGTDDLANLRAACQPCNLRRGAGRGHVRVVRKRWSW